MFVADWFCCHVGHIPPRDSSTRQTCCDRRERWGVMPRAFAR